MKYLLLAAAVALSIGAPAHAQQSSGRTPGGAVVPGQVPMCPNGVTNADGSFQVVPCGGSAAPSTVTVTGAANTTPSPQAPLPQIPLSLGRTVNQPTQLPTGLGRTGSPW